MKTELDKIVIDVSQDEELAKTDAESCDDLIKFAKNMAKHDLDSEDPLVIATLAGAFASNIQLREIRYKSLQEAAIFNAEQRIKVGFDPVEIDPSPPSPF